MTAVSESSSDLTANEISGISGTWADPTYDAAGNMISGPKAGSESNGLQFEYDGWNRLTTVKSMGGTTIATYAYDGRGYRIQKVIAGGDTTDYYYSENHQVIEERTNGGSTASNQYVWGLEYVDALVTHYTSAGTRMTTTYDAQFDITSYTRTSNGDPLYYFAYTPYGKRSVFDVVWSPATTTFAAECLASTTLSPFFALPTRRSATGKFGMAGIRSTNGTCDGTSISGCSPRTTGGDLLPHRTFPAARS